MSLEFIQAKEAIKCWTCDNDTDTACVITGAMPKPICSECLALILTETISAGSEVNEDKAPEAEVKFKETCLDMLQTLIFAQKTLKEKLTTLENQEQYLPQED